MDEQTAPKKRKKRGKALHRTTNFHLSTNDTLVSPNPRGTGITDNQLTSMYGVIPDSLDTPIEGMQRLTVGVVAASIVKANGLLSLVAMDLKCSPRQIQKYIDQHPTLSLVQKEVENSLFDKAEAKLFELVNDGDLNAIRFVLKSQRARERKWTEVTESTVNHNVTIPVFKYSFSGGSTLPRGPGQPAIEHREGVIEGELLDKDV